MKRNISVERRAEIGQAKRARTRTDILKVAFDLLGREDGRATRIDDVCKAAHVSRGTFYNYFSSMDILFDELGFEISRDLNSNARTVMSEMHAGAERASAAVRYYLKRAREDSAWGWAVVNLSAPGPLFGTDTFRQATMSIADGIEAGEFYVSSVTIGRDLTLGTVLASMITMLRSDQPPDYPEMVARQILVGLGVKRDIIDRCIAMPLPDASGTSLTKIRTDSDVIKD